MVWSTNRSNIRSSTVQASANFSAYTVDDIPDEEAVWNVKNVLSRSGTFDTLFNTFREYLNGHVLSFNKGKIIDVSFVDAPRQRATHEENRQITSGNGNGLWKDKLHKVPQEYGCKVHKETW